ncbi:MAG: glycosyltransferase [Planctomycetia bacterium]|nr:glycosyltransferase [Planctomycetia bacterium]
MPSVAYWTSALFPEMEAIAGEVALLRRHFRPSVAWGVSPARWLQLSWRRGFGVHPRMHLAFRAVTWALQKAFAINHVFGSLGDWFHLKAARKRPVVLTAACQAKACEKELLQRVDRFVVEWPGARDELLAMGIEPRRIRIIFPPVDTKRFYPSPPPDGPFTVLFASSPERADWLEARGVPCLLEAAAQLPAFRFRLLWRPWGNAYDSVAAAIRERELTNVVLRRGRAPDMAAEYANAHVTIAPFNDATRSKAIPNSLLESLACGRPVLTTPTVGLSQLVRDQRIGTVCDARAESVVDGLRRIQSEWHAMSTAARQTAERWFDARKFVEGYGRVYLEAEGRQGADS